VHLVWDGGKLTDAGGGWRGFVIRGSRYYLPRPILNHRNGSPYTIYLEQSFEGTQRGSYKAALPFGTWHATEVGSVGNTNTGNTSRRGYLQQFRAHNSETGFRDDLVYMYKHENGQHYQTALGNDRLQMVWRTPHDELATVGTTEKTFVENDFISYSMKNDGQNIHCVTSGEFGATANNKTLKVYFGNSTWSKTVTHNAKQYILTVVITKRALASSVIVIRLEVDGVLTVVEKLENTQSNTSGTRTFKITGTGVANNDIKAHNSRLTANREESGYHQSP